MSHKSSRLFLSIIAGITVLFASAALQAQQSNQRFQGGGPILAQIGGTGPFYGNETGTNTWYGQNTAASLTTGIHNAFFGWGAGNRTTGGTYPEGSRNAFFGSDAGQFNRTGNHNSFIGSAAGFNSTTGVNNTYIGSYAGYPKTTESNNSFFGAFSDGAAGVNNATAIGFQAKVTQSNSLVLGGIKGINDATADTKVGIGTTEPLARLHVQNGDIYLGSPSQGVILKSPDGTKCAKLSIDNSGALTAALQACPETAPPEKAILISPTGSITGNTPTYTWNAVWNATWYQLWVNDSSTSGRITKWYTASQAGCSSGNGTCSVTPSIPLTKGNAQWWIQTWNEFGSGDWSDVMTFTVP